MTTNHPTLLLVLVDEGQDFSDAMLKIVMALLNPATNHLTIAQDENQNIYQRRRSWKEMGIQARGRVHSVKGFDYACVFLLGLDWLTPGARWSEEQIRKLVHVAATRARERLFIPYSRVNEVVKMVLLKTGA